MIKRALSALGFINDDGKISITNITVMTFVFITSFKTLFGGLILHNDFFTWKVETVDVSATLPLLFSLLNYGHKRTELNKKENE